MLNLRSINKKKLLNFIHSPFTYQYFCAFNIPLGSSRSGLGGTGSFLIYFYLFSLLLVHSYFVHIQSFLLAVLPAFLIRQDIFGFPQLYIQILFCFILWSYQKKFIQSFDDKKFLIFLSVLITTYIFLGH